MSKRFKMSKGHSRRSFTRSAKGTHRKNVVSGATAALRGGIRL